jgi:hypothetical protein
MSKFERCRTCRFKIVDGQCRNCGTSRAIPHLRGIDEVDERLEPTLVLPDPYDCVWERSKRPTMPIAHHTLPVGALEELIAKRQG